MSRLARTSPKHQNLIRKEEVANLSGMNGAKRIGRITGVLAVVKSRFKNSLTKKRDKNLLTSIFSNKLLGGKKLKKLAH